MIRRDEAGFTLPELLVAIIILGIIMVAIGSMIVTSFRTTSLVSSRLSASRGPKTVSRYWIPDVESAEAIDPGSTCGSGGTPVATLAWTVNGDQVSQPDAEPVNAGIRVVTWWDTTTGAREQLVRATCLNGAAPDDTTVVVPDLSALPAVFPDGRRVTITVKVPDKSSKNSELEFEVTGYRQVDQP